MKKIIAVFMMLIAMLTATTSACNDTVSRTVHGIVYETYTVEIDGYIEDMTAIETDDGNIWEVYDNIDADADLIVTFDTMGTDAVEDDIITQVVTIINY